MPLYFNAQHLPNPHGEYVLWCDGMGTGRTLNSSIRHAANFIFKLHAAFDHALANVANTHVYPLMDGMYVTSASRVDIQAVIQTAFRELAEEFLLHNQFNHRFIARGGLAYGVTLHGSAIPHDAFVHGIGTAFEQSNRTAFVNSTLDSTRSRLLLSAAMVPAYNAESLAPPFGIYVDDSALSVPELVDASDRGFPSRLWRWWLNDDPTRQVAADLASGLIAHYDQAANRSHELAYPEDSMQKHRSYAEEYFGEFLGP